MTRSVATSIVNVSRRGVLGGVLGGLLVTGGLALALRVRRSSATGGKWGADAMPHGVVHDPHVFLTIAPDGIVTIFCHRAEMGQGVRSSLPLIVADELEADWARVKVEQAPGDEARFGNQDTDGSRSTRHFFLPMRQCGAAARMMLEQAAAKRWGVPPGEVAASHHQVVHPASGRTLGYGELAAEAGALPTPDVAGLRLKTPAQFRYIGKEGIAVVDGFDITTGRAQYGQDVRLPGQKYAVVARPPVMGGKVASFDAAETMKISGVLKVVRIAEPPSPSGLLPAGGLAVVAENTFAAIQGRNALKIVWTDGAHGAYDSATYRAALEATARQPGVALRKQGDFGAGLAGAARKVEAEYYIPHLAHATMEPPSATARIVDGKVEVWTSVQSPQAARDLVAKALGVAAENVTIAVMLLGGGFGRKSKPDFAVEAALISKEFGGAPVKVVWTREDDIRHDFFHTVSLERLEAGLDPQGKTIAWRHNSVAPTIQALFTADPKHEAPFEAGMGLVDMPFDIANISIENGAAEAHTRIGWFRSVSNISHAFAIQCFAAELAASAGRDPKAYLLDLIGPPRRISLKNFWDYGENPEAFPIDTGRLRNIVELVAEKAEWDRPRPARHGLGLAVHRSFLSYVAAIVEVAVGAKGDVRVMRVDIAIDCGPTINPDRVRAQMEGAVIMGLSLASKSEITFKNGRAQQSNFDDYPVLRINEAPGEIHVHIAPHGFDTAPGGVGEPGMPPIAPAFVNAIHAATGKRIRSLPLGQQLREA